MADKNKNEKTNVMRILDKESVPYQVHTYSPDTGIDALSVSNALGQDPQTVFKTLVTQGKSRAYYVFVIPATGSLNLKHAAAACGEKAVEMIPQKALLPNTGYIHGGCSPIGMKKLFPRLSTKAHSSLTPSASAQAKSVRRSSLRPMRFANWLMPNMRI